MFKNENTKEQAVNQDINNEQNGAQADANTECGAAACDNMADATDTAADNLADGEPAVEDALTIALAEAAGWKDKYIRLQALRLRRHRMFNTSYT